MICGDVGWIDMVVSVTTRYPVDWSPRSGGSNDLVGHDLVALCVPAGTKSAKKRSLKRFVSYAFIPGWEYSHPLLACSFCEEG